MAPMPDASGSPIGIVAGNGTLPLLALKNAKNAGLKVAVAAHIGETDPRIETMSDEFCWIRVAQLGKLIKFFKKNSVAEICFAGGIKRAKLLTSARPDFKALQLVARLGTVRDDILLRGIASEFENNGIKVFSVTELLEDSVPIEGVLTNRGLVNLEKKDAWLAWEAAGAIGKLDIGQGAVAFQGIVLAVEAVEGTDRMIERAAGLSGAGGRVSSEHGPVLVKRSKPQQDLRLDLPTVGCDTLELLKELGFTALVLEAGKAIILEPEKFVKMANKYGIAVEVYSEM